MPNRIEALQEASQEMLNKARKQERLINGYYEAYIAIETLTAQIKDYEKW